MPPSEIIIDARGLSKVLAGGHCALHEFTGTIRRGERIALVGANGAGKSTLLRLLNLSYRPTTGSIFWAGTDVVSLGARRLRELRSRIGTIPQKYDLIPQLSARANVMTGRSGRYTVLESFWRMFMDKDRAGVARVLETVGVAHLIDERCDRLSGGEQQRVAIARALFQNPEVLFADEPLAAVDPASAAKLMELLVEVCAASSCALVMTSHHLHLLKDYFPRVIGLRGGRVFFDAAAGDLTPRLLSSLYGGEVEPKRSASSSIERPQAESERSLRVGVGNVGCESVAGIILPELLRAHPNIALSVRSEHDDVLVGELGAGTIDIAFVINAAGTEQLAPTPVCHERVILVCSKPSNEPHSTQQLPDLTLLWSYRDHPISRLVVEALEKTGVAWNVRSQSIELGSLASVKLAVLNGFGCAFLPHGLVAGELLDGLLHEVPIAGFELSYPIYAVRRPNHGQAELVDGLVELAREDRALKR